MKGKMPLLFTRLLISKKKGALCWLIRLLSEKVKYRKLKKKTIIIILSEKVGIEKSMRKKQLRLSIAEKLLGRSWRVEKKYDMGCTGNRILEN